MFGIGLKMMTFLNPFIGKRFVLQSLKDGAKPLAFVHIKDPDSYFF